MSEKCILSNVNQYEIFLFIQILIKINLSRLSIKYLNLLRLIYADMEISLESCIYLIP